MDPHFLDDQNSGDRRFDPTPWYNPDGDCLTYQIVDEAVIADRIDGVLTLYRSAFDQRPIGFQIKGVQALVNRFGWEGLARHSVQDERGIKQVSVAALLLAAYETGPRTIFRRRGYGEALQRHTEHMIPVDNLQTV